MGYHSLSDSGGDEDSRRVEASRILELMTDLHVLGQLNAKERNFVDKMAQGFPVTPGQLFWLRDLKTKICE
jgi:hypothetical protein